MSCKIVATPCESSRTLARFEFGKPVIKRESFVQLDALADTLESNKSMKLEVQAHTDERGDDKYNLEISQKRAEAVRLYLINKGIDGGSSRRATARPSPSIPRTPRPRGRRIAGSHSSS